MLKYKKLNFIFLIIFAQIIFSCKSIDTKDSTINHLEKFWTENDYEIASDSLTNFMLNSDFISKFKLNRKPKIVVGNFIDNSKEKLNTELIAKNVERDLISSGLVTFVSSKSKREELRNDRKNSMDFTSQIEFKKYLSKTKADYFIDGQISLQIDSLKNSIKKNYKITINVVDVKNIKSIFAKTLQKMISN